MLRNAVDVVVGYGASLLTPIGPAEQARFFEFFTVRIRNGNTRKAYYRACLDFLGFAERFGVTPFAAVTPTLVAAWVEELGRRLSPATTKQYLAGLSMLFDWLVLGHILESNPASSVKGPTQRTAKGKTPVIDGDEARALLSSMSSAEIRARRDRAIIATMLYSFARVGAVLAMNADDLFYQHRRLWLRLHEKGGKLHDMPCHHELEQWLHEYLEMAGLAVGSQVPLFQSLARDRATLSGRRLRHANCYQMVRRRAVLAGIQTNVCNHTFRATGITAYLSNGGTIETAARMANHVSTRTTQLYDRRIDAIVLSEVERIRF